MWMKREAQEHLVCMMWQKYKCDSSALTLAKALGSVVSKAKKVRSCNFIVLAVLDKSKEQCL